MKYRKRPVVIEARQTGLDYDNDIDNMRWCGGRFYPETGNDVQASEDHHDDVLFVIPTLEGEMKVSPLDFVIQGVKGEFYPCKPDIFAATYEPAE